MELKQAENKREFKDIPEMNEAEIEFSKWGYENGRTKVWEAKRRQNKTG